MRNDQNSLREVMEQNDLVTYAYSQYLNRTPRFLTADMVESLASDCDLSRDEAFLTLFAAACGFDTAAERSHREIERAYIRTGVRRLDPEIYRGDRYYQTVKFPEKKMGKWEMRQEFYAPYEPFVRTHPVLTEQFRSIPQLGYFDESFAFPAILENGVEWMTVTPNEIETMREPIAACHGRVLTLGLGLGYFAFHASCKTDVESVTVVERDRDVIELFRAELLPQFPHREKVRIEEADAFAFLDRDAVRRSYDSIFADLWHDQSDGLEMYLRLRRIEEKRKLPRVDYWIEPTLLSALRCVLWKRLTEEISVTDHHQSDAIATVLSDAFLRELAPTLGKTQ